MKVWKKNLVAAAVLVTVCAGIYVNWMYTEDKAADNLTDTLDYEKVILWCSVRTWLPLRQGRM